MWNDDEEALELSNDVLGGVDMVEEARTTPDIANWGQPPALFLSPNPRRLFTLPGAPAGRVSLRSSAPRPGALR